MLTRDDRSFGEWSDCSFASRPFYGSALPACEQIQESCRSFLCSSTACRKMTCRLGFDSDFCFEDSVSYQIFPVVYPYPGPSYRFGSADLFYLFGLADPVGSDSDLCFGPESDSGPGSNLNIDSAAPEVSAERCEDSDVT